MTWTALGDVWPSAPPPPPPQSLPPEKPPAVPPLLPAVLPPLPRRLVRIATPQHYYAPPPPPPLPRVYMPPPQHFEPRSRIAVEPQQRRHDTLALGVMMLLIFSLLLAVALSVASMVRQARVSAEVQQINAQMTQITAALLANRCNI